MIDIKPCPFCGGEAILLSNFRGAEYFIECRVCTVETAPYDTEAEAADAWNRRVTDEGCPNAADIAPVRHGRWETVEGWDGDEYYRCSECGEEFVMIDGTPSENGYFFCPHCGAKMDASS